MRNKAIIFGSLGTLYELGDLERRAFNAAFADAGLDWKWDADLYRDLRTGASNNDPVSTFAADRGLIVDQVALYDLQAKHFAQLTTEERLSPRPGVLSVVSAASAAAMPLALATTESADLVEAVLKASGGFLSPQLFAFVGGRDRVRVPKPSSEIYMQALSAIKVAPAEVVVIEDTTEGVAAAEGLELPTIAFPGRYSRDVVAGSGRQVTQLSKDITGLGCQMRDFAIAV